MTDPPAVAPPQTRPVDEISDGFVESWAALSPLTATYLGIAGHDSELPDLSIDGYQAREDLIREALSRMRTADPRDERGRAAKDAFLERQTVSLERYAAKTPQSQVSVVESELHTPALRFRLDEHRGDNAWGAINARLSLIPAALSDYQRTLSHCADEGHVSARRQLAAVADQILGWTGAAGGTGNFFEGLVARADVPRTLRESLEASARSASSAYTEFASFLERDLLPRGRERDGVGREQYALESRSFLGATVDLDETYAWGWEELKRIEDEMHRVSGRIVRGRRCTDAVAALDADPARVISGKEELPRLDAGACRPDDGRAGRRPFRHPGADPPDRVLSGADERRRHLLHRPERGLVTVPAGCGGRFPRASTRSRPGRR